MKSGASRRECPPDAGGVRRAGTVLVPVGRGETAEGVILLNKHKDLPHGNLDVESA
jgi:hypothetical protein